MRVHSWVVALAAAAASVKAAGQIPFGVIDALAPEPVRIELGSQVTALDSRSVRDRIVAANEETGTHAVLTHSDFPSMSLRMKRIHAGRNTSSPGDYDHSDPEAFCDPGVTSWSGYIDSVDGKSLFFYFFESRTSSADDPVLLWTNGGPGCSSQAGLFMELGPCRITHKTHSRSGPPINGTEYNPYSWNQKANTIFIDQPVGVGYSYSRYGVETGDTTTGAKDVYRFLRILFDAFPEFHSAANKAGFHLSGESYAGRYIPVFASEIVDRNNEISYAAWREGKKPNSKHLIPLQSVLIGNGLTDQSVQLPASYEFLCTRNNGLGKPILSIEVCTRMKVYEKTCAQELGEHCSASYNQDKCLNTLEYCENELFMPYMETGLNPYDISDPCLAGLSPNLCDNLTAEVASYLDRADVRKLVGAEPVEKIGSFSACNDRVFELFAKSSDTTFDNRRYVALLLENGVRTLLYNGDLDFICNYVGHQATADTMDWSSKEAFNAQPLRDWHANGHVAGKMRSLDGLTWTTVYGAPHMVPIKKPAESQAMVNRWLAGEEL